MGNGQKEECWISVKSQGFGIELSSINDELYNNSVDTRKIVTVTETLQAEIQASVERIRSVPLATWKKIEDWGESTGKLSQHQCDVAYNTGSKVKNKRELTEIERLQALKLLDMLAEQEPELFFDMEKFILEDGKEYSDGECITIELIEKIINWDNQHKCLKEFEYRFMNNLRCKNKALTDRNKYIAKLNLDKVKRNGFSVD